MNLYKIIHMTDYCYQVQAQVSAINADLHEHLKPIQVQTQV